MITLYSTHCPKCNVLEKKLEKKGIEFELNDKFDVQELINKGFSTAPILQVDDEYMTFEKANKWLNEQ